MASAALLEDTAAFVRTTAPVLLGLSFFAAALCLAEYVVVRRKRLDDRMLKMVDLVWVCTSAVALFFLLLSLRETALKDRVAAAEAKSALVREQLGRLVPHAASLCMAGRWPGIDATPAYGDEELKRYGEQGHTAYMANGGLVTPDCADPIFTSTSLGVLGDERLWRRQPSIEAARAFEKYMVEFFDSTIPKQRAEDGRAAAGKAAENGRVATAYFRRRFGEIVASKTDAGQAASEYKIIHGLLAFGGFWPFVLSVALAFRLAKARLDVLNARRAAAPPKPAEAA